MKPVSIGNHMISSAIWDESAQVLVKPVGRVQFVVFEKFTSADLSQIIRKKSWVMKRAKLLNAQNVILA